MRKGKLFINLACSVAVCVVFFGFCEAGAFVYTRIFRHKLNEYESLIEEQGVKKGRKPAGEIRIFIVGESAARGIPYTLDGAFSGYLGRLLGEEGIRDVKVINTGVPGRHSFYQKEEAKTLADYGADAVILYAGNNDSRDFSNVMRDVPWAGLDFQLTWHSCFYGALKRKILALEEAANKFFARKIFTVNYNPDDVWHWTDTYLRKKKAYLENPELGWKRKELAMKDYETNLDDLVRSLKAKGIRVLICGLPVVHEAAPSISDWSRKDYEFKQKVFFPVPGREREWARRCEEGENAMRNKNWRKALDDLESAAEISDRYPQLNFDLGLCYRALGYDDKAREKFVLAKDLQIQSPGGDSFKTRVLRDIAIRNGVPYVDLQSVMEQVSPHGLVGKNLFLDHCHLTSMGHKVVAAVLMQSLCEQAIVPCRSAHTDWRSGVVSLIGGDMTPENLGREYLLVAFYHFKGTAWDNRPDYDRAIEYFELARKMLPERDDVDPFLAAAYLRKGEGERAKECLSRLKSRSPEAYRKALRDFPDLGSLAPDETVSIERDSHEKK
jgi:tetratricopeptide (TPR) repeat protein